MTEYKITEQECQDKIDGVCSRCGGELSPIETVDNSRDPTFWPGCKKCSHFDWGIDADVFAIAKSMVVDHHYKRYSHTDDEGSQINGACGIILLVRQVTEDIISTEKEL